MTDFVLHQQLLQDSVLITELPLSMVRLINDAHYPWLILVPTVANVSEIIHLSDSQQIQLFKESAMISKVLTHLFTPDKLNIAALGNMVPQLHLHHIVRYQSDVSWPKPIWGQVAAKPYTQEILVEQTQLIKTAIETRKET